MPLKDKELNKEYHRKYIKSWRKKNPEREKAIQKKSNYNRDYQKWYHNKKKNDPEFIKKRKEYYEENKEYFRKKSRECYLKTKTKVQERWQGKRWIVLKHYGGNPPKCACCGEAHIEFLAIDHINNDGNIHRKTMKTNIFSWLIKNNFPDDFQVLCHNCNLSKAFYGYCPHQKEREKKIKREIGIK